VSFHARKPLARHAPVLRRGDDCSAGPAEPPCTVTTVATARAFALFDTALGACAVAWGPRGIVGVALPEHDPARLRRRIHKHHPEAVEATPPPAVQQAIEDLAALLAGESRDLTRVEVDLEGVSPFHRRVYEIARAIRPGSTMTYGEVAAAAGEPRGAQAVGQAMGANPVPLIVPCHRVLAAGGALGGFSAPGGTETKRRLLVLEGALPEPPPTLFD
jgi:methylated-DNA-[protein]-cysteine S-methyltransferase